MARNLNDTYATRGAAVTASDSADLDKPGFLYIGTTGNIKVTTTEGDTLTFNGIAALIIIWVIYWIVWTVRLIV